MDLDAGTRAVRELLDAVEPITLLERAGAAFARGDEWGLLLAPADELGALDMRFLHGEVDPAALVDEQAIYVGIHPAATLRRVLQGAGGAVGAGETATLDLEPPSGHVRLVGVVGDLTHTTFLRADPVHVERFVALERRIAQLAEDAGPVVQTLLDGMPPPPYDEPLVLTVLRLDEPALVRLRLSRRGAYVAAERPPLIGAMSGIHVGVYAASDVIDALRLRDLDNPAAAGACAFLSQDRACLRSIVCVEDHFVLTTLGR